MQLLLVQLLLVQLLLVQLLLVQLEELLQSCLLPGLRLTKSVPVSKLCEMLFLHEQLTLVEDEQLLAVEAAAACDQS